MLVKKMFTKPGAEIVLIFKLQESFPTESYPAQNARMLQFFGKSAAVNVIYLKYYLHVNPIIV